MKLQEILGIAPKLADIFGVSQEQLAQSYNEAPPVMTRGMEMPFRGTPGGMITKSGNRYVQMGFGAGTLASNAKAPAIRIGKNLFKGLAKNEAQGWLKWATEKGIKTKIGK